MKTFSYDPLRRDPHQPPSKPHLRLLTTKQWLATMSGYASLGNTPFDAYMSLYRYLYTKPGLPYEVAFAVGVMRSHATDSQPTMRRSPT